MKASVPLDLLDGLALDGIPLWASRLRRLMVAIEAGGAPLVDRVRATMPRAELEAPGTVTVASALIEFEKLGLVRLVGLGASEVNLEVLTYDE